MEFAGGLFKSLLCLHDKRHLTRGGDFYRIGVVGSILPFIHEDRIIFDALVRPHTA